MNGGWLALSVAVGEACRRHSVDGGWLALLALACRRHSVNAECLFLEWEGSRLNSSQVTPNYDLEWSECRSKLHTHHPYAGEFERAVWGYRPPDQGSAHTSKTRTPQVLFGYRLAAH